MTRERADVAQALKAAVNGIQPALRESGHRLTLSLPARQSFVRVEPERLERMIAVLLTDAIAGTPGGGAMRLTLTLAAGKAAIVIVGENMALRDLSMPQADGEAIAVQGGTLELRPTNAGIEIVMRMPLDTRAQSAPLPAVVVGNKALAGKRIVVIDDHIDAANALANLLKLEGAEVNAFADGSQALMAWKSLDPHSALIDLDMPGIDGYEVARRVRANQPRSECLLIALTGWGRPIDGRHVKDAGFDHHLVKPVVMAELESLLQGS